MTPEREARIKEVLSHRQGDLGIVLENVHDPHNISAVLRSCDAVGVQNVYVLNTAAPRPTRLGKKSSASARKWVDVHVFDDIEACFSEIRRKYNKIYTTHLSADAKSIHDLDLTESVALVFGNEHSGLSDELLHRSDGNFHIPQVGMIKSLNISVACAVSLYEAYRQRINGSGDLKGSLDKASHDELRSRWMAP